MTVNGTVPLIPEQRQEKLLQLLRDEGIVSTRAASFRHSSGNGWVPSE